MNQIPDQQQYALLEQKMNRLVDLRFGELDERVTTLESPVFDAVTYVSPPNYLPNSHPEYSTLAFGTAGTSAGTVSDPNRNAYNWYYQTAATTNLSASASPLLASGHSGFAGLNADAPIWDYVNGTFCLGGDTALYDIACPLPTDFVYPGQRFYIYLEASLSAGAVAKIGDTQVYCEFWDDTAGQEKIIEGSDFTPTIEVFGAPGSRTLKYKILAATDSGTQILSTELTVTNAPATLSAANHVRLFFPGAPGFIYYGIYRKDGSTYRLVQEIKNSIDLQFFDISETAGSPQTGYPSITTHRPRAFAVTDTFTPGELSSVAFTPQTLTIEVPTTYNRSNTANGQQWFRFGLTNLVQSTSGRRGVIIRRISVSEGYGGWSRSPRDMQAASSPTSSAASAPGSGIPVEIPPTGGGGGDATCLTLDMPVEIVIKGERNTTLVKEITMGEIRDRIDRGERVYISLGGYAFPVLKYRIGTVQFIWYIEMVNGAWLTCSDSQSIYYSQFGKKSAKIFQEGDLVLTKLGQSPIVKKEQRIGEKEVMWITIPKPHQFIANGVYVSNRKPSLPDVSG